MGKLVAIDSSMFNRTRLKDDSNRMPEVYLIDFKNKIGIKLNREAYKKDNTIKKFVWTNLETNGIVRG